MAWVPIEPIIDLDQDSIEFCVARWKIHQLLFDHESLTIDKNVNERLPVCLLITVIAPILCTAIARVPFLPKQTIEFRKLVQRRIAHANVELVKKSIRLIPLCE